MCRSDQTKSKSKRLDAPKANRRLLFWLSFFAVLISLVLFGLFASIEIGEQLLTEKSRRSPAQPLIQILIGDQAYQIKPEQSAQIAQHIQQSLPDSQTYLEQRIYPQIEAQIKAAFAPVYAQVPRFADWYYSLSGEYQRYLSAISSDVVQLMQQKMQALIFQPAGLEQNINHHLARLNEQTQQGLNELKQDLVQNLVDSGLLQPASPASSAPIKNIDLGQVFDYSLEQKDIQRQVFSAMIGVGAAAAIGKSLGAMAVKQAVAQVSSSQSVKIASSLLVKTAGKAAAEGGTVLAGGATGAALCAATGPVALLCGAVGGLITWIAVDKIAIELDEVLNRESFEADIRSAIKAQEIAMIAQLKQAYQQIILQTWSELQQSVQQALDIPQTYRPIEQF